MLFHCYISINSYSCNLLFNKQISIIYQNLVNANVVQIFAIFPNLALQLCLQPHSRSQAHQKSPTPCEFGVRNFQFCELFVGFLWVLSAQTFPRSASTLYYTVSLLAHLQTVALTIRSIRKLLLLLSSNVFWIMSKMSALYLKSFRHEFLCIEHFKCLYSLVGIKNIPVL